MIHDSAFHLNGHAALLPPASSFNPEAVPAELRELCQWVVWRLEERKGKLNKVPYTFAGGRASSTDPATWALFEDAVAAWAADDTLNGIGLVVTDADSYTGIDLDGCIDEQGRLADEAARIVNELDSYTEISPRGRGLRIFIRGRKPAGAKCVSHGLAGFKQAEIYDQARFFTVTGRPWPGTPPTIESRQDRLDRLCERLWPPEPPPAPRLTPKGDGFQGDDETLLDRMFSARNGPAIRRLFDGDTSGHGDDDSGADLGLCNHLAFWTGGDGDRMDRLFRRSGLFRPKWDSRRPGGTYGSMTIRKAIENCSEYYAGPRGRRATRDGEGSDLDDSGVGRPDPSTGRLVLSPSRTLPTAEEYVRQFHDHPDGPTLRTYAAIPHVWQDNRFVPLESGAFEGPLLRWLHEALRPHPKRPGMFVPFHANPITVRQALESIRAHTYLRADTPLPCWLGAADDRPPANELLPCRTVNLHIPTRTTTPATPALFTTTALDFDYDPEPEPPHRWIAFLEQLFGDDLESVQLLQEWFGYCLTQDTEQHKMLLIMGPKRSGKGTIGRVLRSLIGEGNCVGPTTGSLAGPFGLQPLLGKSLAIISDARFSKDCSPMVVERLLCISGEDAISVERKYLTAVTLRLRARIVVLCNKLPEVLDTSNALAGRFMVLVLRQTFFGREDHGLASALLRELPGILKWSLDGLDRLRSRGHFVQPQSVADEVRDLEDLGSPIGAFVRRHCEVGSGRRVPVGRLYDAYLDWCAGEGIRDPVAKTSLGRELKAVVPGLVRRRGSDNCPFYEGIGLIGGPA